MSFHGSPCGELVVVVNDDPTVLDANFDTVFTVVVLRVSAVVLAGDLRAVIFVAATGWFRSTAAWLRCTAWSLFLRNADLHVNAHWLLAAGTWIRLPAWIKNLDDLDFGTRSDVVEIFVLYALIQLNRFAFSHWRRSFVTFVVIEASDKSARKQRAEICCRSNIRGRYDGNRTKHTRKLSHGNLS